MTVYRRPQSNSQSGTAQPSSSCTATGACAACEQIKNGYSTVLDQKFKAGVELLKAQLDPQVRILSAHASPEQQGYRTSIKLPVGADETGAFTIGMYLPGTHTLVPLENCNMHPEAINALLPDLKAALELSGLRPYDENTHTGDVRHIAVRMAHQTGNLMVCVICTRDVRKDIKQIADAIRTKHKITTVTLNIQPEKTNTIYGRETIAVFGPGKLRVGAFDLMFELSPTAFFQVNPWVADQIMRRMATLMGSAPGAVAWDLYCGVGLHSLVAARLGYQVTGIELNPEAVRDAEINARLNDLSAKTRFIAGDCEAKHQELLTQGQPQAIIVNPTRHGIQPGTLNFLSSALQEYKNCTLFYVSCEVETLARDLKVFRENGLKIRQIEAFDMFPFTNKLEWLTVVSK